MFVLVSAIDGAATATAADLEDLHTLEVRFEAVDDGAAQDALVRSGLGSLDGDHVWLDAAALRVRGPRTPSWGADFDAMLGYAAAHGWCSSDGACVRAHVVRG